MQRAVSLSSYRRHFAGCIAGFIALFIATSSFLPLLRLYPLLLRLHLRWELAADFHWYYFSCGFQHLEHGKEGQEHEGQEGGRQNTL